MTIFKRGETANRLILVIHINIVNFSKTSDDLLWVLEGKQKNNIYAKFICFVDGYMRYMLAEI